MRIALVYNPAAGGVRRLNRPARFIRQLRLGGHEVQVYTTTEPGHATTLTRQALEQGAEVIVAVGGDGTVNEVLQGMVGSTVPLGVYPAGTTNVWCKQVRMPYNPRRAARIVGSGPRRLIDLGRTQDRYFLLMTGIGLDGEITQAVDLDFKRKWGKLAYGVAALRLGLHFQAGNASIMLDANLETARLLNLHTSLIIVTNTERYAVMKLAREAQLDDGCLELLVFQEKNLWSRLRRAFSLVTSSSEYDPKIKRYRMHSAQIEVDHSVGVQVDGDPQGRTGLVPLNIECVPGSLTVIVPEGVPARLFAHPHYAADSGPL